MVDKLMKCGHQKPPMSMAVLIMVGGERERLRGSQSRVTCCHGVFVLFAACTCPHSQNIWVSINKNGNNLRLKVIMAVWNGEISWIFHENVDWVVWRIFVNFHQGMLPVSTNIQTTLPCHVQQLHFLEKFCINTNLLRHICLKCSVLGLRWHTVCICSSNFYVSVKPLFALTF